METYQHYSLQSGKLSNVGTQLMLPEFWKSINKYNYFILTDLKY